MMYKISLSNQAEKFLEKLDRKQYIRLAKHIDKLPSGTDIVKMRGFTNRYRLRVGDI